MGIPWKKDSTWCFCGSGRIVEVLGGKARLLIQVGADSAPGLQADSGTHLEAKSGWAIFELKAPSSFKRLNYSRLQ